MRTNQCEAAATKLVIIAMVWVWTAAPPPLLAQPTQEPTEPQQARHILEQHRDAAVGQLLEAAQSDVPALRANALEATQFVPEEAEALLRRGLEDDNPGVLFSALLSVGKLGLEELSDIAISMRRHSQPSVRAAALYAAAACGREVDLSPLALMLASPDPSVRGNVGMLMGMLGDASAIPMLKELAHVPMPRASAVRHAIVRLQIAEALVQLGQEGALDALRAGAYSHYDEVRVLAVQALGKLEDAGMQTAFKQMVQSNEPIELRLAAAEALARTGGARGGTASQAAARVMREAADWNKPAIRAQAAFTLRWYPQPGSARRLVELLTQDPSDQVRVSAAAALLGALQQK